MKNARIILDSDFTVAELDRRLFGAFVEHMGRCVHTGIFEPGHPTADKNGFRRDVLDLAAKRRSPKQMMLSFDEWNVWYKARSDEDHSKPGWPVAPRLIEEIYDLQDALMVGGALITLLNNSDRVRAACLAQLVNVIGPIFTEPGGPAWRQTIFHPFKLVAAHAHGRVLQPKVESAKFETKTAGTSNQLVASAIHNTNEREVVLFVLNRATSEPLDLTIDLRAFPQITGFRGFQIQGTDLLATNTASQPDKVKPAEHQEFSSAADRLMTKLTPLSWNLILLSY